MLKKNAISHNKIEKRGSRSLCDADKIISSDAMTTFVERYGQSNWICSQRRNLKSAKVVQRDKPLFGMPRVEV